MAIFSLAFFLVTLRETIEAALVIGILLAYIVKTGNEKYTKYIWIGTAVAIIASLVGAVLINTWWGGLEGDAEKLFEGTVMIIAAFILTWMIVWMKKNAKNMRYELEEKLELTLESGSSFQLVLIAFVAVFREGIETVLFFVAIEATEPQGTVIFSGILGIVVAVVIAIAWFRSQMNLNLRQFFNVSSILLILFAAGLFAHGFHEFDELGWFGTGFITVPLLDLSGILNDEVGVLGPMLRALFGYQDKPDLIEMISYVSYWVFTIFLTRWITRTDNRTVAATTAGT